LKELIHSKGARTAHSRRLHPDRAARPAAFFLFASERLHCSSRSRSPPRLREERGHYAVRACMAVRPSPCAKCCKLVAKKRAAVQRLIQLPSRTGPRDVELRAQCASALKAECVPVPSGVECAFPGEELTADASGDIPGGAPAARVCAALERVRRRHSMCWRRRRLRSQTWRSAAACVACVLADAAAPAPAFACADFRFPCCLSASRVVHAWWWWCGGRRGRGEWPLPLPGRQQAPDFPTGVSTRYLFKLHLLVLNSLLKHEAAVWATYDGHGQLLGATVTAGGMRGCLLS
jgi:hypothetical protein